MMGGPHLEVPGTFLIVLGVAFIVFRSRIAAWFSALLERIWNSERSKELQGFNPRITMKPSMATALGIAWIMSGIMLLLVV